MTGVVIGALVAALVAGFVYLGRERLGAEGLGLAALRTIALAALLLGLLNPGNVRRVAGGPPTVLLDASLSFGAAGGRWTAALDTARALILDGGTILRFGASVSPFDTAPPEDGATRLADALRVSVGRGGPVIVVTDGEIEDAPSLQLSLLDGLGVVTLPRDTVPTAALRDVVIGRRLQRGDTLTTTVVIESWGDLGTGTANIEILLDERRLVSRSVSLPASAGVARRSLSIPPGTLPLGTHVLRFRLDAPGDRELRDNERQRVVTVSSQPAVVVVVSPADIEGRFLMRELALVVGSGVRGYARVQPERWLDMTTLQRVEELDVRATAARASLVVIRGGAEVSVVGDRQPVWHWPAATDPRAEFIEGDWYVTAAVPPSPLAGRLAAIEWDTLPPVTGVVPLVPRELEWIGLTGRLGRRGAERPLLVGRDSTGTRRLTTGGAGLWRWVLRGGAAHEAYRAIIAAGADWLLGGDAGGQAAHLTASREVARGVPVAFRWVGDAAPDSLVVVLASRDTTVNTTLRFDPDGVALELLEPGVYRWTVASQPEVGGVTVVEEYSDEFHPRPLTMSSAESGSGFAIVISRAREHWWLFVVAALAFLGEWGWRQRRGLP